MCQDGRRGPSGGGLGRGGLLIIALGGSGQLDGLPCDAWFRVRHVACTAALHGFRIHAILHNKSLRNRDPRTMVRFDWAQNSIDTVNEVAKCDTGEEIERILLQIVMAAD